MKPSDRYAAALEESGRMDERSRVHFAALTDEQLNGLVVTSELDARRAETERQMAVCELLYRRLRSDRS